MITDQEFKRFESVTGKSMYEIETPALVVDLDIMERNMDKMDEFLSKGSVRLRPHYKTNKTNAIARMQMERGALGITCAKVGEAESLVEGGITDILIANQVVGESKIKRAAALSKKVDLKVAVDSEDNLREISRVSSAEGGNIGIVVEVEVGQSRGGVRTPADAVALARLASNLPGVHYAGVMGYEGHTVFIPTLEKRREAAEKSYKFLFEVKDALTKAGFAPPIVSAAGTGTHMLAGRVDGITDVEAGSYVFMDLRYAATEGVNFKQSLFVLATVSTHPEPEVWVTDAGIKTMTKEFGTVGTLPSYGLVVTDMSEEHIRLVPGKQDIPVETGFLSDLDAKYGLAPGGTVKAGDKILLIPSHCCTTTNLHDVLYAVRNGKVEHVWRVEGRGRSF